MELGENETRFIEYVNRHLEDPLKDGILRFRTWKSCADISDIDVYHQVAQSLQQKELAQGRAGLFYTIKVPEYEGDLFGDLWNVNLVDEQDRDFLSKYGSSYKVTSL
jgi:hypothetical protein